MKRFNAVVYDALIPLHDQREAAMHYIAWMAHPGISQKKSRDSYIRSVGGLLHLAGGTPPYLRPKALEYPDQMRAEVKLNKSIRIATRDCSRLYGVHDGIEQGMTVAAAVDRVLRHADKTKTIDPLPVRGDPLKNGTEPKYQQNHWQKPLPVLPLVIGFWQAFLRPHADARRTGRREDDFAGMDVLAGAWVWEAVPVAYAAADKVDRLHSPKRLIRPRFVDSFVVNNKPVRQ